MGIPCVTVTGTTIQQLQGAIAAQPQQLITVDLEHQQIQSVDGTASLKIGAGSREMLLQGTWDACGQLVAQKGKIHL